jgi:hypothetical protein
MESAYSVATSDPSHMPGIREYEEKLARFRLARLGCIRAL